MNYKEIIKNIKAPDQKLLKKIKHKIDFKTKPLGSLGKLEEIAVKISLIQNSLNPDIKNKSIFVFASDHGIAEEGVSAFPQEVTAQMVYNFLNGGAAINVLCKNFNIDISIIDMGVNHDFKNHNDLIIKKVGNKTKNFLKEQAMTEDQAIMAIQNGMEVFFEKNNLKKIDLLGLGEMGIANTTSASAIICAITDIDPDLATGRGTGIDDKKLIQKINVIKQALNFHKPDPKDAIDIIKKIGGFEIAGITGAVLAAASEKTTVVLDGLISTAGGLLAYLINPDVKEYIFAGHKSIEQGQKAALDFMNLDPIIDLNMRLGEGTGASIAINIIEASCKIMREMASFDEAGVSNK